MTYDDLLKAIQKMTPEQKQTDVTICTSNEFYHAELLFADDVDNIVKIISFEVVHGFSIGIMSLVPSE